MHHSTAGSGPHGSTHSFEGIIEDPEFARMATLYRGEFLDADDDAYSDPNFEAGEELELFIISPDAAPLEIDREGPDEPVEYAMAAMSHRNVTTGDRVEFDDGTGASPYRVGEPEKTSFDGDEFSWHILTRDERGDIGVGGGSGGTDGDYDTY